MSNSDKPIRHEPETLPGALVHQAHTRGGGTALRQKRLGIWQVKSWQSLLNEAVSLSQALLDKGFVAGDSFVLLTHPRAEAVTWALAAQYVGGVAIPLDPAASDDDLKKLLGYAAARYFFAEDQEQVDRVLALIGDEIGIKLLAYAEDRGLINYRDPFLASHQLLLNTDQKIPDLAARPP